MLKEEAGGGGRPGMWRGDQADGGVNSSFEFVRFVVLLGVTG